MDIVANQGNAWLVKCRTIKLWLSQIMLLQRANSELFLKIDPIALILLFGRKRPLNKWWFFFKYLNIFWRFDLIERMTYLLGIANSDTIHTIRNYYKLHFEKCESYVKT